MIFWSYLVGLALTIILVAAGAMLMPEDRLKATPLEAWIIIVLSWPICWLAWLGMGFGTIIKAFKEKK